MMKNFNNNKVYYFKKKFNNYNNLDNLNKKVNNSRNNYKKFYNFNKIKLNYLNKN
jgi:hypothetical protein